MSRSRGVNIMAGCQNHNYERGVRYGNLKNTCEELQSETKCSELHDRKLILTVRSLQGYVLILSSPLAILHRLAVIPVSDIPLSDKMPLRVY